MRPTNQHNTDMTGHQVWTFIGLGWRQHWSTLQSQSQTDTSHSNWPVYRFTRGHPWSRHVATSLQLPHCTYTLSCPFNPRQQLVYTEQSAVHQEHTNKNKKKKRLSPTLFCKCKLFQNPIWFPIPSWFSSTGFHNIHIICSDSSVHFLKSITLSPSHPPNFKCQTTFDAAAWQQCLANPRDGPWHERQWSHLVNESLCWQTLGEGVEEGLGEGVYCIRYTGAYTLFYIHMVHDHTRWQTK